MGVASVGAALPPGLQHLVEHVTKNKYKPDLLQALFGNILEKITPEEFKYLDSLKQTYTTYKFNNEKRYRITSNLDQRLSYQNFQKGRKFKILFKTDNIFEASLKTFILNKEAGIDKLGRFSNCYFYSAVINYRSNKEEVLKRLSKSLTGKKQNKKTIKKRLNTWLKTGHQKPLLAYTKDHNFVNYFESIEEAARKLKVNNATVSSILNPKHVSSKSTKGYTFVRV